MQQVYVPDLCKGEGAIFSGSVTLKLPDYEQTLIYQDYLNVEITLNDAGEVDSEALKKNIAGKTMFMIRQMSKHVGSHIEKVELKRLEDGKEFNSVEMMTHSKDCFPILREISMLIMNGLDLGKN